MYHAPSSYWKGPCPFGLHELSRQVPKPLVSPIGALQSHLGPTAVCLRRGPPGQCCSQTSESQNLSQNSSSKTWAPSQAGKPSQTRFAWVPTCYLLLASHLCGAFCSQEEGKIAWLELSCMSRGTGSDARAHAAPNLLLLLPDHRNVARLISQEHNWHSVLMAVR